MESKFDAIRDIILRNIPGVGNYPTSIDGVRIVRRNHPTEFLRCFYNPSCILVLQGTKHMLYGSENLVYERGKYVVSCTDIPVSSRVVTASDTTPFVVMLLEFDSKIISEMIAQSAPQQPINANKRCLAIADIDESLLDAFYRLAQLIEHPQDQILSSIIIREIYYRLLTGELGNQLRQINTKGTRPSQITKAISLLKNHFANKLNIEDIAAQINMSSSAFYRNFKQITGVSPLQYQKQLRLYEAQRLMLSGIHNAESASYLVGYESPTQFSREYKKLFGNPPKTDIKYRCSNEHYL